MKGLSNNRGFTLVEVLVVMAISTILLGVLIGIIVSGNKQYTRIKKEDETFSELQMVRKAITNELKSNNKSVKLDDDNWCDECNKSIDNDNISNCPNCGNELDEDYHKLLIGDYYIAFIKKSKTLRINNKKFNFKYIEDISYNWYSTLDEFEEESNLLIITIDYGKEVPYKIYFSCMNLGEDTST